jgi:hypothetical protein
VSAIADVYLVKGDRHPTLQITHGDEFSRIGITAASRVSTEGMNQTAVLEGLAGTCTQKTAVAELVSKIVYHPRSPRLARRGKRLLHYQPYPSTTGGRYVSCRRLVVHLLGRVAITAHPKVRGECRGVEVGIAENLPPPVPLWRVRAGRGCTRLSSLPYVSTHRAKNFTCFSSVSQF